MGGSIRSMPETHIPKLDRHVNKPDAAVKETRAKSILHIALEVILISVGVFLGLAGEQWREHRRHQELAESSLRDFRSEIVTNRKEIADVKDYHATLLKSLKAYLGKAHKSRNTADVQIQGLRFVSFDQTAWDLALTTQALTYIDRDLAFELSRVYNEQKSFNELTRGMTQAMYLIPSQDNFDAFAQAAEAYYGDAVFLEPKLIEQYDQLILHIDRVLGS
jgi:hypothetical protein